MDLIPYLDGAVSIVALGIVAIVCVAGIFSNYNDNLLQRAGMSLIAAWSILRISVKLQTWDTEPVHLVMHVGLAMWAVGALLRQRQIRRVIGQCNCTKPLRALMLANYSRKWWQAK